MKPPMSTLPAIATGSPHRRVELPAIDAGRGRVLAGSSARRR